jgi:DNA-directed RNA polymerase specialized sigma54-like protein
MEYNVTTSQRAVGPLALQRRKTTRLRVMKKIVANLRDFLQTNSDNLMPQSFTT